MFAQTIPIGINLNSSVTWFVISVALVVLALAVSTRRATARPRSAFFPSRRPTSMVASSTALRERFAAEWRTAQALFVEAPLAGSRQAQAIVDSLLRDSRVSLEPAEPVRRRYRSACASVSRIDATTDELREAFIAFRAVFDALLGESALE